MNEHANHYSPNVQLIRDEGIRIIKGSIFRFVRNELMDAVKSGALGRLRKDGLKPEVFYHPDLEKKAIETQINWALNAIKCIEKIIVNE